jgi:hypothetical protein
MNERIKELYEQAHIERRQEYFSSVVDPTIKSVSVTRHFNPNLFAELIVRECLALSKSQLVSIPDNQEDWDGHNYGFTAAVCEFEDLVKEHFGVEE